MKFASAILFTCLLALPIATQPIQAIEYRSISVTIPDGRLSVVRDEFSLLRKERIGNLRIGLSEAKVKQIINCQLKREPEQFWGADGAYHQQWKYANCGIILGMVSARKGAPKSIDSITISNPSRLTTQRGIRIGGSKKAVMKAYKAEWNRSTNEPNHFVAGSIYGGLIFQFENGNVSQIFLGAAAE
jgi:hypothetical protein